LIPLSSISCFLLVRTAPSFFTPTGLKSPNL
jgi:hypothetical protein